jgi:hypothetical protein
MVQRTKAPGVTARRHLTVSQPRLPNLLDRVVGVTTKFGVVSVAGAKTRKILFRWRDEQRPRSSEK